MKVYLVEDVGNNPGKIWAVMKSKDEAEKLCEALEDDGIYTQVIERGLVYGQAYRGYNE